MSQLDQKKELPILMWYPATVEPSDGEPIMFVSKNWIKYYVTTSVRTGVNLDMPNEVQLGTYVGNGKVEVHPLMPPVSLGVWTPLPLFFFESSIRTLSVDKERQHKKVGRQKQNK